MTKIIDTSKVKRLKDTSAPQERVSVDFVRTKFSARVVGRGEFLAVVLPEAGRRRLRESMEAES